MGHRHLPVLDLQQGRIVHEAAPGSGRYPEDILVFMLHRLRETCGDVEHKVLSGLSRGNQGDSSATNKLRVPCGEAEVAAVNAKRA